MTTAVLLRSGMMGNYHVPFCRAVEGATPSLTLMTSSLSEKQAQSILIKAFEKHDVNVGITWESLRFWSEEFTEGAAT